MRFAAKFIIVVLAIVAIPLWLVHGAWCGLKLLAGRVIEIFDDIDRSEIF